MDDQRQQEYQKAFLQLKRAYIQRLENTIRIIDKILDLEKLNPPTREDLSRAQALFHGLAGSGATFGFPQITDVGREADHFLEVVLKQLPQGQKIQNDDRTQLNILLKKVQQVCRTTCHEARLNNPDSANTNQHMGAEPKDHAHILIVDDDPDVATAIAQGIESMGMTFQISASGEEAMHYLARIQPDLVILDMALKGIDGLEVLQQIKQNPEFIDIPVLILSTRHNERDEQLSLRIGALGYIHKPVEISALSQRVRQIIESGRKQVQSI